MVWQIWVAKCKFKHGDGEMLRVPSEQECLAIWESFQHAKPAFAMSAVMGMSLGERKWRRPKRGEFRVDVDVLFDEGARAFGVGVIVRNELGMICAAMSKRTQPTTNSMIAEVMAVVAGIVFCMECDIKPIRIYTNSMLAARVMADPAEEVDFLPLDIREILVVARDSILIGVFHTFRSANEAAHCLAQYARSIVSCCQWMQDFPHWLRDIVRIDDE